MSTKDNKRAFIIFTPEHVKNDTDLKVYAIYPDYWGENINLKLSYKNHQGKTIPYKTKHNWGEIPCLGYVKETNEYWACYAAYSAGLLPLNGTFGPRPVQIKTKLSDIDLSSIHHQMRRRPQRKFHPSTKR